MTVVKYEKTVQITIFQILKLCFNTTCKSTEDKETVSQRAITSWLKWHLRGFLKLKFNTVQLL